MRTRLVGFLASAAMVVPRTAGACTPILGVDVEAFYAELMRPPYELWAVSLIAALIWFATGARRAPSHRWSGILLALAVLHPAWWIRGDLGDCGAMRDGAALVVAASSVILLATALFMTSRRPGHDANSEHQAADA